MTRAAGEISDMTFDIQWAQMLSDPYHVWSQADPFESMHYMMMSDSMRFRFEPKTAETAREHFEAMGMLDQFEFVSGLVDADADTITQQILQAIPLDEPREPMSIADRIEEIVAAHQADAEEIEPELPEHYDQVKVAVISGLKVAYVMSKQGFAP